jgi:uncharacterized protein
MSYELEAGYIYDLYVERTTDIGYRLTNGSEDVFLHEKEATEKLRIEDEVTVFLYNDHTGRLAATMTLPIVSGESFAWLKVVGVHRKYGVFLDIGIQKDMLLSRDDLPENYASWPTEGDELYCTLATDKKDRLFAKLATFFDIEDMSVAATDEMYNTNVTGTIYKVVEEGASMITENRVLGFIHESEMNGVVRLGQKLEGRVIMVKDDGTVNLSLLPRKQERLDHDAQYIYEFLQNNDGKMLYGDKSSPESIKPIFNMSKGAFKRALGTLMKQGKIEQKDGWTYLKNEEN